jgi:membrane associated rhomboid family serine protease
MAWAPVRLLRNLGLSVPPMVSVSSLLAAAMLVIYARMWIRWPGEALGGWSGETLLLCGSNYGPLTLHGEWWRAGTSIFLHIGVLHIAFNLLALAQIGPSIEEIFGRGRMVFFFLATGLAASFASAALHVANAAGASGALMGLVGIAAGWGQRVGGLHGKNVRNQMLKWGAYTIVFGFAVHADNVAHAAGFASGALLGFAHNPHALDRGRSRASSLAMGALGALGSVATVALVLALSSRAMPAAAAGTDEDAAGYDGQEPTEEFARKHIAQACDRASRGDTEGAWRELFGDLPTQAGEDPKNSRAALLESLCAQQTSPDSD